MKIKVSKYVAKQMHRTENQIIMKTFKASGNGGQYINKTESGVLLIDTVTGLRAESSEERKQNQNRKIAKKKLVEKLVKFYTEQEIAKRKEEHAIDLTKIIRTYDFKNGVKDSRLPSKTFDLNRVLEGKELGKIINELLTEEVKDRLKSLDK